MGTQGFYSFRGEILTRRDLAVLPKDAVIRCHIHTQHKDLNLSRIIRSANRRPQKACVLPNRLASFSKAIDVPPSAHDGTFMATDYTITLTSEPLIVRKSFGIPREGFHGGRKKMAVREITWLKPPKDPPRSTQTRAIRRIKPSR